MFGRKKQKRQKADFKQPKIDHRDVHEERKYGLFWYDWLWRILRPVLVMAASFCLVAGVIFSAWKIVYAQFIAPPEDRLGQTVTMLVQPGESVTTIANKLNEEGLIRHKGIFKYYVEFMGKGQSLQTGEYELVGGMTMDEIIGQLMVGDGRAKVRDITIIPGWTIETMASYLTDEGVIPNNESFLSLCKDGTEFKDFHYVQNALAVKNANQRRFQLEGYLAPNTYQIYTDASVESIINKLLAQTDTDFSQAYQERAAELNLTVDEVITLASIIEKEGKNDTFTKVSAVFHNRLRDKMPLQSCVTVQYVQGHKRLILTNAELNDDNLYNTYKYSGLPIGPVCSPSKAAIYAALYPDEEFLDQGYMYFCSADPTTGELVFSKTLDEHEKAVKKYQPLWEEYDKSVSEI